MSCSLLAAAFKSQTQQGLLSSTRRQCRCPRIHTLAVGFLSHNSPAVSDGAIYGAIEDETTQDIWIIGNLGSLGQIARCIRDGTPCIRVQITGNLPLFLGSGRLFKCADIILASFGDYIWQYQNPQFVAIGIAYDDVKYLDMQCLGGAVYAVLNNNGRSLFNATLCTGLVDSSSGDQVIKMEQGRCSIYIETTNVALYLGHFSDNNLNFYTNDNASLTTAHVWLNNDPRTQLNFPFDLNIDGQAPVDNFWFINQIPIVTLYPDNDLYWYYDNAWHADHNPETTVQAFNVQGQLWIIKQSNNQPTQQISLFLLDPSTGMEGGWNLTLFGPELDQSWVSLVCLDYNISISALQHRSILLLSTNGGALTPQPPYLNSYQHNNILLLPDNSGTSMTIFINNETWILPYYNLFNLADFFPDGTGWTLSFRPNAPFLPWTFAQWTPQHPTWTSWNASCFLSDVVVLSNGEVQSFFGQISTSNVTLCYIDMDTHLVSRLPAPFSGYIFGVVSGPNGSIIVSGDISYRTQKASLIIMHPNFTVTILESPGPNLPDKIVVDGNQIYYLMPDPWTIDLDDPLLMPRQVIFPQPNLIALGFFTGVNVASVLLTPPHTSHERLSSRSARVIEIVVPIVAVLIIVAVSVVASIWIRKWKKKSRTPLIEYVVVKEPLIDRFTQDEEHEGRYLARGAFGSVATVRHPNGGLYALKKISTKGQSKLKELALQEIEILKMLQHKNTICLRDSTITESHVSIYTDLFDGAISDLYAKRTFKLKEIMTIATGIGQAIKYIQSLGLAHRDIKPANILVTLSGYDRISNVHLADFGLAVFVKDGGIAQLSISGSYPYMAPEVQRIEQATESYDAFAADVFSYGVTIWELCHGQKFSSDFDTSSPILLREELKQMKSLIKGCRSPVAERWSIDEVLAFLREEPKE
eukprot:TRINITY_DN4414_c0_g1_i1.p1 TRINITY_DN4414_c0_g1~~TRINITY_DN4414_c0_g1_i1.p1  ORF type:complete len:923 (+),score=183.26 TRINITY_DN4414_c0_g1_i1:215-2983(+)